MVAAILERLILWGLAVGWFGASRFGGHGVGCGTRKASTRICAD